MSANTPAAPAQIAPLPQPPTLADPENFDSRGDEFLGAIPGFQSQANTLAQNVSHNAGVAHQAAQTSTGAAATATQQADAAMGYRNTAQNAATTASTARNEAVTARNEAVPAAASALNSAQRAEAAAAGISDGPVTSVNGKTGVVTLTPDDLGVSTDTGVLARMYATALCF